MPCAALQQVDLVIARCTAALRDYVPIGTASKGGAREYYSYIFFYSLHFTPKERQCNVYILREATDDGCMTVVSAHTSKSTPESVRRRNDCYVYYPDRLFAGWQDKTV